MEFNKRNKYFLVCGFSINKPRNFCGSSALIIQLAKYLTSVTTTIQ